MRLVIFVIMCAFISGFSISAEDTSYKDGSYGQIRFFQMIVESPDGRALTSFDITKFSNVVKKAIRAKAISLKKNNQTMLAFAVGGEKLTKSELVGKFGLDTENALALGATYVKGDIVEYVAVVLFLHASGDVIAVKLEENSIAEEIFMPFTKTMNRHTVRGICYSLGQFVQVRLSCSYTDRDFD